MLPIIDQWDIEMKLNLLHKEILLKMTYTYILSFHPVFDWNVFRLESTTSRPPWSLELTLPRSRGPSACCPTPRPSPRPGPGWTTSSTWCTPRGPSSTGTSGRAWRRESSPRPGRISPLSRRTTRRSDSTLRMPAVTLGMNIDDKSPVSCFLTINSRENETGFDIRKLDQSNDHCYLLHFGKTHLFCCTTLMVNLLSEWDDNLQGILIYILSV